MTVRELASGIDALYLSGYVDLEDSFLEGLERARDRARGSDGPVPYRLGGVEFGVPAYGLGLYSYQLSHEFGRILFTASRNLPSIRVQPKAELLHGIGPRAAVDTFIGLLAPLGETRWSVNRLDLFADVQGWWPSVEDRDRFVGRATTREIFEKSEELTGFQFGRRKGGGLSARVYEKSGQISNNGLEWWRDVWGEALREGEPVARVEFEFGRKVLRECEVETPEDAFADTAGLWGYATEWLSYRDRSGDETRSRWPVSAEWEALRNVSLRDRAVTIERITTSSRAPAEKSIRSGLCGYVSSLAAIRNITNTGDALVAIESVLRQHELETGIPFAERVKRKRQLWEWGL